MWYNAVVWVKHMLSLAAEMRGRTATVALALCFSISNTLEPSRVVGLGISDQIVPKLLTCAQTLGTTKCLTAFSAWRAQKAIKSIAEHDNISLNADLEQFPWQQYTNASEDHLYTELCDGTEALLQYRRLGLNINSDYALHLGSRGNGTLTVDVFKSDDMNTGRGYMKKLHKKFYNIVPFLLLPGLIMSAILPFVLPALKMMTVAVGILNNMALSGAVFTLLRNNAFNEANRHRIIYANVGYHNEKDYAASNDPHHYSEQNGKIIGEFSPHDEENIFINGNTEIEEDIPLNADLPWLQNGDISSHVYHPDTNYFDRRSSSRNKNLNKVL
ncbi:unnamed protein product [Parnassius apollo]|uniref:(apollo) hypothetical protein n=1 Tax=Parnassius apollo TaxID=110799 RepID=A0A8S3WNM6_PARAO|nr:unnamed protein product [Parnassius apollo]